MSPRISCISTDSHSPGDPASLYDVQIAMMSPPESSPSRTYASLFSLTVYKRLNFSKTVGIIRGYGSIPGWSVRRVKLLLQLLSTPYKGHLRRPHSPGLKSKLGCSVRLFSCLRDLVREGVSDFRVSIVVALWAVVYVRDQKVREIRLDGIRGNFGA